MSDQSEALKARSMAFGVAVLLMVDGLPGTPGARVAAGQLAKSATSVGANYRAACTARSRGEFISKLCTVNEEADESVFWLELFARANYGSADAVRRWLAEAIELRAIFATSLKTARDRQAANRVPGRGSYSFAVNPQPHKRQ